MKITPKLCNAPECGNVQPCPDHPKRKPFEGASRSNNYDAATWGKASAIFLRKNKVCAGGVRGRCAKRPTTVDHIIPPRGDLRLFWDVLNWQALCKGCHDAKTAREVAERKKEAGR